MSFQVLRAFALKHLAFAATVIAVMVVEGLGALATTSGQSGLTQPELARSELVRPGLTQPGSTGSDSVSLESIPSSSPATSSPATSSPPTATAHAVSQLIPQAGAPSVSEPLAQAEPSFSAQSSGESFAQSPAESGRAADLLPEPGPLDISGQAVFLQEGAESSGRLRGTVVYPIWDSLLVGAEADLAFGEAFGEARQLGFKLNELYAAYAPPSVPELRFVGGLVDLTSYFDRNSFAKDKTTHFFNSVFETNPALSAAGIDSTPSILVNWSPVDAVELKAAGFSSSREISDWALDAFAGEVGVRWENLIVRGTYSNAKDAGRDSGFEEIFQFDRGNNQFGLREGDREEAYGLNAEFFIPEANVGLFGRYGHYRNQEIDEGGDTFSFGVNWLDAVREGDRLGLGYGRALSQDSLRRDRNDSRPDVIEAFYDFPISEQARAAVSLQGREELSEAVFGFRVKGRF